MRSMLDDDDDDDHDDNTGAEIWTAACIKRKSTALLREQASVSHYIFMFFYLCMKLPVRLSAMYIEFVNSIT